MTAGPRRHRASAWRRPSWDEYFLQLALQAATRSTCLRRQVGAVLVRDKRLLATGYNGAPRGVSHCLDIGCLREELGIPSGERHELCRAIHAEQNAVIQAAVHGVAIEGADAVLHAPPLHPVRQDPHQLRGAGDPLPRGLPRRPLSRDARRGRGRPRQGGPDIGGPLSLSSPLRTAILGFLIAAFIVYVLTPLMGRLAHRTGAVDTPTDDRRMHELATPLLGGLAMYLGWMIPVMLLVPVDRPVWGIIGGATIVVAVGLFDDLYELEPIVKFIGQLLAIGVAIYFDTRMTRIGVPFTDELTWHMPLVASIFVTGFWMAMIINMVNFIDGLDGLAAGVCGISALTFAIISLATNFPAMGVLAAVLAGATFAFLRFNFHPASIFMGDAGSMLLGFVLACISVQSVMKGTAAIALVLPLLVLGVPFVDLFLIVWRRWRRGVPFYSAGQDHVHHDLVLVHGFSQRKSVLVLYSWCACLSALAISLQQRFWPAIVVFGVAAAVSTIYMARLLSRYRSRRARPAGSARARSVGTIRPRRRGRRRPPGLRERLRMHRSCAKMVWRFHLQAPDPEGIV